jgi:acetyl esterase/lipase
MTTALRDAKIPVELHLLPSGGHGYGLRPGNIAAETWPVLTEHWLKKILVDYCREHKLSMITVGTYSNVVRVLVPSTVTDDTLEKVLAIIENGLKT